jgi:hypothetical protein
MLRDWILNVLETGQWTVALAIVMLVVHARVRFNSPPTNRSGTTAAMFFFGLIFYCALIFALWIVVILSVKQGSIGFYNVAARPGDAGEEALRDFRPYAGVVAALVIVVAAQVPWVRRIDDAARTFCIKLAAIPREADRLALELAHTAEFQPKSRLRERIAKTISEAIGPKALRFQADDSLEARFTRAVGLYYLFIGPSGNGTQIDFANTHARSIYIRILHLSEATVARVVARYRELMQTAAAYFKTPHPDLVEPLNRSIDEVSQLTCGLIARYVLYANATKMKRRQRLANMGFDASRTMVIRFGLDQWVATILAVILLSAGIMASAPGMRLQPPGQILIISISFGLTIGCAVMGAVVVAQRFMERHEGDVPGYPPIAELTAAALIVAGLSAVIRLGVPLVCVLLLGEASEVPGVFNQFRERLPGLLVPTFCTISLGLLCIYLGARPWSQRRLVAAGAIGNALAFMAIGALVAAMIDNKVLAEFYVRLEYARPLIVLMSGVTGAAIGAMVLFAFRRSERARRDDAEHAAEIARVSAPGLVPPAATEELEAAPAPRSDIAAQNYGGYSRANAAPLEGRYVCFRPGFVTDVISAYIVDLRWDDAASCLIFEERDRADPEHAQRGRVYMPDGRPFMSFVTVARGAVRVATLSRPDKSGCARGLLMTLSNPAAVNFTPACSPIVLKRVTDSITPLGFIEANTPDYEVYRRQLEAVVPKFGLFAPAPGPEPGLALAAE